MFYINKNSCTLTREYKKRFKSAKMRFIRPVVEHILLNKRKNNNIKEELKIFNIIKENAKRREDLTEHAALNVVLNSKAKMNESQPTPRRDREYIVKMETIRQD